MTELSRKTPLRRRRPGKPRRGPVLDPAYLRDVRMLPCCKCGRIPPSDPHHAKHGHGLGQKADDCTAIPLCRECHESIENPTQQGPFYGWSKSSVRAWHDARAQEARAIVERLRVGRRVVEPLTSVPLTGGLL